MSGYLRARTGGSQRTVSLVRTVAGTTLYGMQVLGSIVLVLGATTGLYIAATALVLLAAYSVSGAWLLLVGAHDAQPPRR